MKNFQNTLASTNQVNKDKLNRTQNRTRKRSKSYISNEKFKNTLGNINNASTDKLNHETKQQNMLKITFQTKKLPNYTWKHQESELRHKPYDSRTKLFFPNTL